jgi:hypothetical protein
MEKVSPENYLAQTQVGSIPPDLMESSRRNRTESNGIERKNTQDPSTFLLPKLPNDRDDTQEDNSDGHEEKVLLNPNHLGQQVTGEKKQSHPSDPAGDIVKPELEKIHLADPRDKRGKGPNDRDEPRQDDRFGPISIIKPLGSVQVLAMKPLGRLAPENLRTSLVSDPVVDRISQDRSDDQQRPKNPDTHGASLDRAERSGSKKQRIPG